MTHLVLDAGPLIALFYHKDRDHMTVKQGFIELSQNRVRLVTSAAIVLEVCKRIFFLQGREPMRQVAETLLLELEIIIVQQADLQMALGLLQQMPHWDGTCEDAIIAKLAMGRNLPLWTMNYRDLAAFKNIVFWNPT